MHLYFIVPLAAAAGAAAGTATASSTMNSVTGIVVAIVMAIVSAFAVPFLKAKQAAAEAEVKAQEAIAMDSNMSTRQKLIARVKAFLWGRAAAIAEKEFPVLAQNIRVNGLGWEQIKGDMRKWGKDLREEAKTYFSKQGIDLAAAVGDDYLDKLIERAANAVSPFPGRDTAKTLLQENVTDWLINKGVGYVKARFVSEDNGGKDLGFVVPVEG